MAINISFETKKFGKMESALELERRTEAKKTRNENRHRRPRISKIEEAKNDEEKFGEILDCCKQLLSTAVDKGDDFFELLDPLISDTQCHLHSVLLLNILHKCYNNNNNNEFSSYGIDALDERDQKILSYAVLFSLSKFEYRDELGFLLHQVSMNHYSGSILPSRNRETYCMEQARKIFNSYSVDYMRSVAGDKTEIILKQCTAVSPLLRLAFLPCYASYLAVIDYIGGRKLPIILTLVSVNAQVTGKTTEYNMNSNEVRFYEFRENEKKFFHKKELSDYEKKIPTIAFRCYTISTNSTKRLQVDGEDLKDLLMLSAAIHIQLPKTANIPAGYEDGEEYAKKMYENNADVLIEYEKHHQLAKERGLGDVKYSRVVRSSVEQGGDRCSVLIERTRKEIPLLVDHVCLSNYSREYERLKNLDFSTKLDEHEVFEFSKTKDIFEVLGRFTVR